ncbi:MAG TPA: hypothetical protein VD815_05225 [Candidatus Saccharimonadales bacterium]|nr:hypothetical protein [Candidatus Saccharimonadales bacterium]
MAIVTTNVTISAIIVMTLLVVGFQSSVFAQSLMGPVGFETISVP